MKANQGIILLMFAALILWLVWSENSPFKNKNGKVLGAPVAPTTDSTGKTLVPPGTDPNATGAFPSVPSTILPLEYTNCIANGGTWDSKQGKCFYGG